MICLAVTWDLCKLLAQVIVFYALGFAALAWLDGAL
jgi:hypothetical protein